MQQKPPLALIALTAIAASQTQVFAKVDWQEQVWPFIERSCVECHKAPYEEGGRVKNPKADLRFDGAWAILVGGENGPVLTPGDPEKSEMFFRVILPEDDSDFMPPKGEVLSDKEKELLKQWIVEGADFGAWEGSLEGKPEAPEEKPAELKPFVPPPSIYDVLAEKVSPAPQDAIDSVINTGARVDALQKTNPLLRVDFFNVRDETDDATLAILADLRSNLAQLNLSEAAISDAGLKSLSRMKNLVHLDLRNTKITDAGLAHLKDLSNLRYLNLYGTGISDAGLSEIQNLKNLEAVYLWRTKVTEKGAKELESKLPNARVSFR
ncbi:MAG: c-type cytochrome domain-containing protein [Verrucomicrobiota bacterium]